MDDFRSQVTSAVDEMLARGVEPVFMVVDLTGMGMIKKSHGQESLDKFHSAVSRSIASAGGGCAAFTYGDDRAVAVLGGFDRLKTFALADKLRRSLPYLAQSFDCILQPAFDIIEYDPALGVAALISELAKRRAHGEAVA